MIERAKERERTKTDIIRHGSEIKKGLRWDHVDVYRRLRLYALLVSTYVFAKIEKEKRKGAERGKGGKDRSEQTIK